MKLEQLRATKRGCGGCSACCTTCGVPELNKQLNEPCQHLRPEGGCSIYEHRPASCARFRCAWLAGLLPEDFRPDKSGVVFVSQTTRVIQAFLVRDVPFERVNYLFQKMQRVAKSKLELHIVPVNLRCDVGAAYAETRMPEGHFIAERQATQKELLESGQSLASGANQLIA